MDEKQIHAETFKSMAKKVFEKLKPDIDRYRMQFMVEAGGLLEQVPDASGKTHLFMSWLLFDAEKNGRPVLSWFDDFFKEQLTPAERTVLQAASKNHLDWFKVIETGAGFVEVQGIRHGGPFWVDYIDMPPMEKGSVFFGRIVSKGNSRYFFYGALIHGDSGDFEKTRARDGFLDGLGSVQREFQDYLAKQGLAPKTIRQHARNVQIFMHFLEDGTEVSGFDQVTKGMVKSRLHEWVKRGWGKPDLDAVRTSVRKFFVFLKTEKNDPNDAVLDALQ